MMIVYPKRMLIEEELVLYQSIERGPTDIADH